MRKILSILTPENVYIDYELAGVGSRFAALCIDYLIQLALIILTIVAMAFGGIDFNLVAENVSNIGSTLIAVGIALIFIITFGYFVLFEFFMNGQSPGKKVLKLRVLRNSGEPINFFDSLIRNLVRIVDMLPSFYLIGTVFIVFSKEYKRLGDYAANTIVVRVKDVENFINLNSIVVSDNVDSEHLVTENIYPTSNIEYSVLREFVSRVDNLGDRKRVFEYHLNNYFCKKYGLDKNSRNPYDFFNEILSSK